LYFSGFVAKEQTVFIEWLQVNYQTYWTNHFILPKVATIFATSSSSNRPVQMEFQFAFFENDPLSFQLIQ